MSAEKLAVTYDIETGEVFQHFGHCKNFKVYNIADNKVASSSVESSGSYGHGGLATFLANIGVEILICGGIGGGAQNALHAAGIKFYGGVQGQADKAVEAYLAGDLAYNPNVHCDHHHDHGNHHDHSCGGHNEGGGHNCCGHED